MKKEDVIKFWLDSAEQDKESAISMFRNGQYHWSLFVWHLALEKLLKSLLIARGKEVLKIHNLNKLAELIPVNLTQTQQEQLIEISGFNLEARYTDYKNEFRKKADKKYAEKWNSICKDIYEYLKG